MIKLREKKKVWQPQKHFFPTLQILKAVGDAVTNFRKTALSVWWEHFLLRFVVDGDDDDYDGNDDDDDDGNDDDVGIDVIRNQGTAS